MFERDIWHVAIVREWPLHRPSRLLLFRSAGVYSAKKRSTWLGSVAFNNGNCNKCIIETSRSLDATFVMPAFGDSLKILDPLGLGIYPKNDLA